MSRSKSTSTSQVLHVKGTEHSDRGLASREFSVGRSDVDAASQACDAEPSSQLTIIDSALHASLHALPMGAGRARRRSAWASPRAVSPASACCTSSSSPSSSAPATPPASCSRCCSSATSARSRVFRQHARWDYMRRMLPPACVGIVAGWLLMRRISDAMFRRTIGWIILTLAVLQFVRMQPARLVRRRAAQPRGSPGAWVCCRRDDDARQRGRPDLRAVRAGGVAAEVRDGRHRRVALLHHQRVQGAVQRRARPDPSTRRCCST